jgi:hypothetical protein
MRPECQTSNSEYQFAICHHSFVISFELRARITAPFDGSVSIEEDRMPIR